MSSGGPGQQETTLPEYEWLCEVQRQFDRHPSSLVALRVLQDASSRYLRAVAARERDESLARTAAEKAALLDSKETQADEKIALVATTILVAVAVTSGAAAGVVGALVVKESVITEAIKGAIGGFVTTGATLAAERALSSPGAPGPRVEPAEPEPSEARVDDPTLTTSLRRLRDASEALATQRSVLDDPEPAPTAPAPAPPTDALTHRGIPRQNPDEINSGRGTRQPEL